MLEKELQNIKQAQNQLEEKIREEIYQSSPAILPVEEGIKKAKENKTLQKAAELLADQ